MEYVKNSFIPLPPLPRYKCTLDKFKKQLKFAGVLNKNIPINFKFSSFQNFKDLPFYPKVYIFLDNINVRNIYNKKVL